MHMDYRHITYEQEMREARQRFYLWTKRLLAVLAILYMTPLGSVPAQDNNLEDNNLLEEADRQVESLLADTESDPTMPPLRLFKAPNQGGDMRNPASEREALRLRLESDEFAEDQSPFGKDIFQEGEEVVIVDDVLEDDKSSVIIERDIEKKTPLVVAEPEEIMVEPTDITQEAVTPQRQPKEVTQTFDQKFKEAPVDPMTLLAEDTEGHEPTGNSQPRSAPVSSVQSSSIADDPQEINQEVIQEIIIVEQPDPGQEVLRSQGKAGKTSKTADQQFDEAPVDPMTLLAEDTEEKKSVVKSQPESVAATSKRPGWVEERRVNRGFEFFGDSIKAVPVKNVETVDIMPDEDIEEVAVASQPARRPDTAKWKEEDVDVAKLLHEAEESVELKPVPHFERAPTEKQSESFARVVDAFGNTKSYKLPARGAHKKQTSFPKVAAPEDTHSRNLSLIEEALDRRWTPTMPENASVTLPEVSPRTFPKASGEVADQALEQAVEKKKLKERLTSRGHPERHAMSYRQGFFESKRGQAATQLDSILFGQDNPVVSYATEEEGVRLPRAQRQEKAREILAKEASNPFMEANGKDPEQITKQPRGSKPPQNLAVPEGRDVMMSDPFTGERSYTAEYNDSPEEILQVAQKEETKQVAQKEETKQVAQKEETKQVAQKEETKQVAQKYGTRNAQGQIVLTEEERARLLEDLKKSILADSGQHSNPTPSQNLSDVLLKEEVAAVPAPRPDYSPYNPSEKQVAAYRPPERSALSNDQIQRIESQNLNSVQYFPAAGTQAAMANQYGAPPAYQHQATYQQAPSAFELARQQASAPWNRGRTQLYQPGLRQRSQFMPYNRMNSTQGYQMYNPAPAMAPTVYPATPGAQHYNSYSRQQQSSVQPRSNERVPNIYDTPPHYQAKKASATLQLPQKRSSHMSDQIDRSSSNVKSRSVEINNSRQLMTFEQGVDGESLFSRHILSSGTPAAVVYFRNGSSHLSPEDGRVLRKLTQVAKTHPGGVLVLGHASARTKNTSVRDQMSANLEISMKRARAVRDYLIKMGVPSNAIETQASGQKDQEFQETMPRGEAWNRRVEVYLR